MTHDRQVALSSIKLLFGVGSIQPFMITAIVLSVSFETQDLETSIFRAHKVKHNIFSKGLCYILFEIIVHLRQRNAFMNDGISRHSGSFLVTFSMSLLALRYQMAPKHSSLRKYSLKTCWDKVLRHYQIRTSSEDWGRILPFHFQLLVALLLGLWLPGWDTAALSSSRYGPSCNSPCSD